MILLAAGIQSALEPAGAQAERIARLWDVFLVVLGATYVITIVVLLFALLRRHDSIVTGEPASTRSIIIGASGLTAAILFALLVSSIFTTRGIAEQPRNPIDLVVTAHQWWWQFEYDSPDKSQRITTANEITVPVGTPVRLQLRSPDVIHSLWVPNLHGKHDLIPGHDSTFIIEAGRPGVFRGQCAEFCGIQHAKMAFWVNALPRAEFDRWLTRQRKSSEIPSNGQQRKGQEVFMESPCPLCHTVAGTDASGKTGPDLTHFASRRSIAAGTLPNRRGYLAGWIIDPQHVKPGSQMPPMVLDQGKLEPLLDYMESLR